MHFDFQLFCHSELVCNTQPCINMAEGGYYLFFLKADIIGCKPRRQCFLKFGRADSEDRKSCSVSDIFKLNLKCIYFSLLRDYEGVVGLITTVLITIIERQLITMCRNKMSN